MESDTGPAVRDQLPLAFNVQRADDDNLVWNIIQTHVGAENAIQSDAVQAAFMRLTNRAISKRTVSAIVERLGKRGKAIYGSKRPPYGYYVLNGNRPNEVDAAYKELRASAIAILIKARRLKRLTNDDLVGQLRLDLAAADAERGWSQGRE